MEVLVTGCAGFIGFSLTKVMLSQGIKVIGIDNLSDYYSLELKEARLSQLQQNKAFSFYKVDICDYETLKSVAEKHNPMVIVHLAAQAGVRYSLTNPFVYTKVNVDGHLNILEIARNLKNLKQLVYASSSSVYGSNSKLPFSIEDRVDNPSSLYAATKRAGELMSQTYHRLYDIPMTGLRFFTVYGPWGRPDMSPILFAQAIQQGKAINVFNYGKMKRDFTYIDDIVSGILAVVNLSHQEHRIYNLGNHKPVELLYFIELLEKNLGKKAQLNLLPMQKEEMIATYADIEKSQKDLSFLPATNIEDGIARFVEWYKEYYKI